MKYLYLKLLMFVSITALGQQKTRGFNIGLLLHDFNAPGGTVGYDFRVANILSVGPAIDFTSYESKFIAPVYANVKLNIPTKKLIPFVLGQAGYSIYSNESDLNGGPAGLSSKIKGGALFGGGAGLLLPLSKVGVFIQYAQRFYSFSEEKDGQVPSNIKSDFDLSPSIGIISAGIRF